MTTPQDKQRYSFTGVYIHARALFEIIDSPIYTYGVDFRLLFLELGNAKALKRRQQENVYAFFMYGSTKLKTKIMINARRLYIVVIGLLVTMLSFAQEMYKVTAASLNIRRAPSAKSQILGACKQDSVLAVLEIENGWAQIEYKGKVAYISAKYLEKVEIPKAKAKPSKEPVKAEPNKKNEKKSKTKKIKSNPQKSTHKSNNDSTFNNWGIDFLPSMYVGASDFIGDYMPVAHCGFGFDMMFQFYQKHNSMPRGWMSQASVGYAMKGGGGMPIHYFTMILSPAGYAYTFKHDVTLYTLLGLSFDFGGGYLYANYQGNYKTYYANPCDVGMQLKIATEWRKFGFAVSYDQGFLNTIENSRLSLKNFGFNFHFSYRLWDIPHNQIYKP